MGRAAVTSAVILLGCLGISGVDAASGIQIFTETGRCTRLIVGGKDLSQACNGKMVGSTLPNGRVTFDFFARDSAEVHFGGDGRAQVKLSYNKVSQPIDDTAFTLLGMGDATRAVRSRATGQCVYSNPYSGQKAEVICEAVTADGRFAATFISNGQAPTAGTIP